MQKGITDMEECMLADRNGRQRLRAPTSPERPQEEENHVSAASPRYNPWFDSVVLGSMKKAASVIQWQIRTGGI